MHNLPATHMVLLGLTKILYAFHISMRPTCHTHLFQLQLIIPGLETLRENLNREKIQRKSWVEGPAQPETENYCAGEDRQKCCKHMKFVKTIIEHNFAYVFIM